MRLAGRAAVITGASRGLGAGLAQAFRARGLRLGLCARTEMIKQIVAATGVKIDIDDDGRVHISSPTQPAADEAIRIIREITAEAEVGQIYHGKVKKIIDFGAFVEILPNTDGLVHISELAHHRVKAVTDILKEGDEVMVKVLEVDRQGKIRLSRKALLEAPEAPHPDEPGTRPHRVPKKHSP